MVKSEEFDRYASLLRKGIWSAVFFDKAVFICRLPTKVMKDDEGRLHSVTQGAVQWADGLDNHFINGVGFDKSLWERISSKSISSRDAILLSNIEQRTVALRALGYDHVLKEIGAKVIDSTVEMTRNGRPLHYEVLETNLQDDGSSPVARFVKVECPSTGKEAVLRVDPKSEATRTCKGAVGWTFGMGPLDYDPLEET